MPTTKLNNGQLPTTLSSKTIDNSNDINTTTTRLKISGGSNGQVLSTDGASNLSWITAGGGVSDGDKGDITVASSGTVWTIDNGVVSYAKLQDVSASSRLLGRATAGSGDAEEITIGSGLSVSGTTLSALGAPTYEVVKTADETVTSSTTLQNDDHLFYTLPANKSYFVQLHIMAQKASGTANIGPTFALDASSTGYWQQMLTSSPVIANSTNTLSAYQAAAIGGFRTYQLYFAALNVSSSITLQVKWAQGASNPSGATVFEGSKLQIWEVA